MPKARKPFRCGYRKGFGCSSCTKELFAETEAHGYDIEILINNAGFGALGNFAESEFETVSDMVKVNVLALTELAHLYVPKILKRTPIGRPGRILMVSSIAGFVPGPLMAVYFATKAYVSSLSEALSEELSGSNATVTCVAPGPVVTQFPERAGTENVSYFRKGAMNPGPVAVQAYEGMMKGKRMVIVGLKNRLQVRVMTLVPRAFAAKRVRRMHSS